MTATTATAGFAACPWLQLKRGMDPSFVRQHVVVDGVDGAVAVVVVVVVVVVVAVAVVVVVVVVNVVVVVVVVVVVAVVVIVVAALAFPSIAILFHLLV